MRLRLSRIFLLVFVSLVVNIPLVYSTEIINKRFTPEQIASLDEKRAIISTPHGEIELKFYADIAPNHVDNFIQLAEKGFYDGTIFHRVIPGFMIQGGDPNGKSERRAGHGTGGPGYGVKAEFSATPHKRGILSMARSSNPDSGGSQFFICVADASFLDNKYTVFGEVVRGMDVVDKIVSEPRDRRDNPNKRMTMNVRITDKSGQQYAKKTTHTSSTQSRSKPAVTATTSKTKKDTTAPVILITSHNNRAIKKSISAKKTLVRGQANDASGISEVLVNGSEAWIDENGFFEAEVLLRIGKNNIEVQATDIYRNRSSKVFVVTRQSATKPLIASGKGPIEGWYGKQYALIIGIDKYKNQSIDPLANAANDAMTLAEVFRDKGFIVRELYNKNATRKAIMNEFSHVIKHADKNDGFVFYFAGHGQGLALANGEKVGYIIPYDANVQLNSDNVVMFEEETIGYNSIRKYAKGIKAKHVALLFDSCFSGLVMERSIPNLKNLNKGYYREKLKRRALNILTAGADQPVSDGSAHSPFTEALLLALKKGNVDLDEPDGFTTFTEIAAYVKEKVQKATNGKQRPQHDNDTMDAGDYIFEIK